MNFSSVPAKRNPVLRQKFSSWREKSEAARIRSSPNPRGSVNACRKRHTISSGFKACKTNTLQRDNNAPLTSKEGFSVVAPMSKILPFSTKGKNASCCALLKRWISSTKRMVFSPNRRFFSACSITCLISLIPLVTAEKSINVDFVLPAIMRASVVFPTPGGPQKIMDPILSLSIRRRRTFPSPSKCVCPTNSSSVRGRNRAASGRSDSCQNIDCCSIALLSVFSKQQSFKALLCRLSVHPSEKKI